jgi:hypothetical protein
MGTGSGKMCRNKGRGIHLIHDSLQQGGRLGSAMVLLLPCARYLRVAFEALGLSFALQNSVLQPRISGSVRVMRLTVRRLQDYAGLHRNLHISCKCETIPSPPRVRKKVQPLKRGGHRVGSWLAARRPDPECIGLDKMRAVVLTDLARSTHTRDTQPVC